MNNNKYTSGLLGLAMLVFSNTASSATPCYLGAGTGCEGEADYVAAILALNKEVQAESFENNAVWSPRSTPIAPAPIYDPVPSKGIDWSSNSQGLPIATYDTLAYSGQYHLTQLSNSATAAFWEEQSTNPDCLLPGNCGDGFSGFSTATLYGVGGWIQGTGKVGLFLDGSTTNVLEIPLSSGWNFVGVILDPLEAGFTRFEFREMEYVWQAGGEGWNQLRSDDFKFAVDNAAVVPVPAALPLFVTGLLAFAGLARKKAHRAA